MDSLRPCPFCGGEARTSGERFENTILSWVYCVACGAAGGYRHTEAEAIAAWNTRYHSEFEKTVIKAWKEIKDYQERTCERIVHGLERDREVATVSWTCSECGAHIGRDYRYCPMCGAKVIGGNDA